MSPAYIGEIALTSQPPSSTDPALSLVRFPGGQFGSQAGVDVHTDRNLICMARGQARFDGATTASPTQATNWLTRFRDDGAHALRTVTGRFSVVVIDTQTRSVWMASDRFATWPICYRATSLHFGFADRADAVPGSSGKLSAQSIYDYLFFHAIPAPETIFDDIHRLPAAHQLRWADGKLSIEPWWSPVFDEKAAPDFEDAKRQFLQIIESGVRRDTVDGNTGAFLSGGTDSSTVSGMLCRIQGQAARTYSIGFDANGYDEMEYARLAARHFGTDHHEYYVTPDDLLDGIPRVATHYDQPFGNSSAVPAWICARKAKEDGITKLLAGDGGDELFGGNVRYSKQRVFEHYGKLPGPLRRFALEPLLSLPGMNHIPGIKKGVSYVEQAKVPLPDRLQMYNLLLRLGAADVLEPEFLASIDQDEPFAAQRRVWQTVEGGGLINHMLALDWKYTLADNDLPKVIGTTQLAGVAVDFPLLSDELLQFSLSIPPEWKVKGVTLRWFFKEALRGFLPDEIITKKKHGFGLPFGVWACQHEGLRDMARTALGSFRQRGIVRAGFIDTLINTHLPAHPGYYGEMVWILMMMEFWMQSHAASSTR